MENLTRPHRLSALFLALGLFLISGAIQADDKHPEHVIFFIHGLLADQITFEGFEKALHEDFGDRIATANLTYPTGPADCNFEENDWIHPLHFAQIINTKIIDYYFSNHLDINTPYSLVVHSQGGLTAMIYLNTCMEIREGSNKPWCSYLDGVKHYLDLSDYKNSDQFKSEEFQTQLKQYLSNGGSDPQRSNQMKLEKDFFYKKHPGCRQFRIEAQSLVDQWNEKRKYMGRLPAIPNVANLISIGTPFWGSATANRGQSMKGLLNLNLIDEMAPLEQLSRLAIGSRGTSWQRMLLLNRNAIPEEDWSSSTGWISPYPEGLKVYNIAGDLWEGIDTFSSTFLGSSALFKLSRYESDIIVGAPSARLDTIYSLENIDPEGEKLQGVTNITQEYFVTLLPHIAIGGIPGMAEVTIENKDHQPSYLITKKILDNSLDGTDEPLLTEQEKIEHLASSIENFNSEIKLVTPHGYHRQFSIPRSNIKIEPQNPQFFDEVQVTNTLYAMGHGANNDAMKIKHHYYQTYFHIGKFSKDHHFIPQVQHSNENSLPKNAYEDYRLSYEFQVHGFEPKFLENYVAPSYSSYTEGYLHPFHPIANNQLNNLSDQNNRKIGVIGEENSDNVKVIELTEDMKLNMTKKSKDDLTDFEYQQISESNDHLGRCYVGTMGPPTPDRFRHQILKESLIYENGVLMTDETGGIVRQPLAQMEMINPNYWTIDTSTGHPRLQYENLNGGQLWEKYAANKNYLYRNFLDEKPQSDDLDVLTFGSAVEVLGRYSVGKIEEKSQTGRSCTNQEILDAQNRKPWADMTHCLDPKQSPSIDRYLVTSPEIRELDGVLPKVPGRFTGLDPGLPESPLSQLKEVDGRILGTRWVNVVDIDLFKNWYLVLAPGGYLNYHRGNHCLLRNTSRFSDQYGSPMVYRDYFYQFQ